MLKKSKSKRRQPDQQLVNRPSGGSTASGGSIASSNAVMSTTATMSREQLAAGVVPILPHPISYLLQEPEDEFL